MSASKQLIAMLIGGLLWVAAPLVAQGQTAQQPRLPPQGGRIIGTIAGLNLVGDRMQISGWVSGGSGFYFKGKRPLPIVGGPRREHRPAYAAIARGKMGAVAW
jgi:hypothetical protein